jgi:hypothetical protein
VSIGVASVATGSQFRQWSNNNVRESNRQLRGYSRNAIGSFKAVAAALALPKAPHAVLVDLFRPLR